MSTPNTHARARALPRPRPIAGTRPKAPVLAVPDGALVAVPGPRPSAPATPAPPAYALTSAPLDFDGPFDTALFHRLDALHARTAEHKDLAVPSLAVARGYDRATLFALAEIAHHYVLSGGTRLALVIFEGLAAIAPDEPYFALGVGYALDRAGRIDAAIDAYRRAAALDPRDGRAELNLAELLIATGDRRAAREHLARAEKAATARADQPLAHKARAILARIRP